MGGIRGIKKWGERRRRRLALAAIVAILALNTTVGETGEFDEVNKVGEVGGNNALATEGKTEGNAENDGDRDALERAFWETIARCESPILLERNAAEDALVDRFAEFEPVWQDKRFLTNGEIGAEARARFELAEARFREKAFDECVAAFQATFEIDAPSIPETRNKEDGENEGNRESDVSRDRISNEENGEFKEIGEFSEARGRIRLRWSVPLRIVYLTPDWSAFERRDAAGKRWRSNGRFSAPELAPEFDATELTVETVWERDVAEDGGNNEAATIGENGRNVSSGGNRENKPDDADRGGATIAGVFEGVIGGDFRVWTLPLGKTTAPTEEKERQRNDAERKGDDEAAWDADYREETVFQSGDATATVGETRLKENGETTARVRLEYDEAFDAFDSHRVWFDKDDFALVINRNDGEKKNGKNKKTKWESGFKKEKTERADERRWTAIRWRARERSNRGVLIELDFPNEAAIRAAVEEGRARLECRVPRFFFWTRFPVAGKEKTIAEP